MGKLYILKKGVATLGDLQDGYASAFPTVANNVFYVDMGHAETSDDNPGTKELPLETITAAYALCEDGRGDTIFVLGQERYREDELVIEKDGLSIIGAGFGTQWNRTSSQAGTYVCQVQASTVTIANMQISTNGAEPGIYWGDGGANDANASTGKLLNCFVRGAWYAATGSEGTIGITVDGSSFGPIIQGCYIWGWGTGIDVSDGASRTAYGVHILDNFITGKTYGINWGGIGYTSVIKGNTIWDWKSSVNMTAGINLAVSTGGILVANNTFGCAVPAIDSADLNYWVGNTAVTAEAGSELLAIEMQAF